MAKKPDGATAQVRPIRPSSAPVEPATPVEKPHAQSPNLTQRALVCSLVLRGVAPDDAEARARQMVRDR